MGIGQSTGSKPSLLDLNLKKVETDQGEKIATCNTELRNATKFPTARFKISIKGKSEKVTCKNTEDLLIWLGQQKKRLGIDYAPYCIKVEEHTETDQVTITITADNDRGGLAEILESRQLHMQQQYGNDIQRNLYRR